MPECLICLDRVRNQWTPQTPCACKPILHKKCWNEWIKQKEICVICRVHFGPERSEAWGPDEARNEQREARNEQSEARNEQSEALGHRPEHLTLEEQIHMGMLALLMSLLISLVVVIIVTYLTRGDFGDEDL